MTDRSAASGLWQRWKRLARRAAVVQSNVVLWLLYYVAFVPLALVRRLFADAVGTKGGGAAWRERAEAPVDLRSSRRQY